MRWPSPAALLAFVTLARLAGAGEADELLAEYLRIDTSNPPGRELAAARWLDRQLAGSGVETRVIPLGAGRANFMAVWKGTGARRPVVLLHHMDVVPADPARWSVPPFAGVTLDGFVYGRGAVDVKGKGIVDLLALRRLARSKVRLARDVILLAVADEEVNSSGAKRAAGDDLHLLRDAEIVIDEGGGIELGETGRAVGYGVAVGSKSPLWLAVRFRGRAGHGSVPVPGSALERAVRAAHRLLGARRPLRVLAEARATLEDHLAGQDLARLPGWKGGLDRSLAEPAFLEALAEDPEVAALLTDTVAITQMAGSDKINTLPNEARLGLDCRLLPDTDREEFLAWLRRTLADPSARIEVEESYGRDPGSPADSPFMKALSRVAARRHPGVPVVPVMLTCSTDAVHFRRAGLQAYGFEALALPPAELDRAHGNDERLPVEALEPAIGVLLELLREL